MTENYQGIIEIENTQSVIFSGNEEQNNLISVAIAQANQCVKDVQEAVVSCSVDCSLQQAIEIMKMHNTGFLLVRNNDDFIGFLTYKDIVIRTFISDELRKIKVHQIMSSPIVFVNENSKLSDAYALFLNQEIENISIKNHIGEFTGIIHWNKLKYTFTDPQELLFRLIENCESIQDLTKLRNGIFLMIKPMINETGSSVTISRLLSLFNDALTRKIIQLAIKEMGEAPVLFAFLVLGSAGREELVLNSDQDNALVFAESDSISNEELQKYFLQLSSKICQYLDNSGLIFCKGNYMAQNPKWCQSLDVWKQYFSKWIVNADAENLVHISVFFDVRFVFGNSDLFVSLENFIFDSLKGRRAFFYNLAQNIIGFKPPITVFGNIVTETSGKNVEVLDIKNCLAQVVMFARIYSLSNGIRKTGTIDRINELLSLGILSDTTAEELIFQYNFMMQLRIKHQMEQFVAKTETDNFIALKKLSEMEQYILKKIF